MISDSLYNYLKSDSGISALVSTRVYPLLIPQSIYSDATKQPCLVYTIDTDGRDVRFEGSDSLVSGRVQIDCYARSYAASQTLAAAVRDAMVDYAGAMASNASPVTTVNVQKIFLEGEASLTDPEPGLYRVMQQYVVWYDES